jgi:hypothetical protein
MIIALNLRYRYCHRLDTRRNDYRLEPGDIDIIIAHGTPQFIIIASEPGYRYYHRLDTPQFMIIAFEPGASILFLLTHAIYDYRLEPGDIDIIIAHTRRKLAIIAFEPGDIILLSPRHTPQFMIIALRPVISILLSP